MRVPARTWGLSLVLLAASACGSSASDPTVLPAARWGAEYAGAVCAKVFGCCDATELATWNYADEAQCRQMAGMDIQTNLSELLSIGWVSYDPKAARRCVDEIAATPCSDLLVVGKNVLAPSCFLISRGTGGIGAVCEDLDVVCRSSNCDISVGTCGPTRGCTAVCGIDEYCDATTQACAKWKAEGASCASAAECAPPLSCLAGVCAPQRHGGAACNVADDCISLVCAPEATCGPQLCDGV